MSKPSTLPKIHELSHNSYTIQRCAGGTWQVATYGHYSDGHVSGTVLLSDEHDQLTCIRIIADTLERSA